MLKEKNWGRDLLFALALIALVRHVQDHCSSKSSINECSHENLSKEEKTFAKQVKAVKCQIKLLEQKLEQCSVAGSDRLNKKCRIIRKNLDTIYHDYFKLSPATVLLGPIGAVSQVMRERKVKDELLKVTNRVGAIAQDLVKTDKTNKPPKDFKKATTIESGIENNRKLLEEL